MRTLTLIFLVGIYGCKSTDTRSGVSSSEPMTANQLSDVVPHESPLPGTLVKPVQQSDENLLADARPSNILPAEVDQQDISADAGYALSAAGACNVEVFHTTATFKFQGLQAGLWPYPPWNETTSMAAADAVRNQLQKIDVSVRADQSNFTLFGTTLSYVFLQYYENTCQSHFSAQLDSGWKYMGAYRGSLGAFVSVWAAVGPGGTWNGPVVATGASPFYRKATPPGTK